MSCSLLYLPLGQVCPCLGGSIARRVCSKCQSDRLVNNGSAASKSKKLCQ
jgi:hypothetical protein